MYLLFTLFFTVLAWRNWGYLVLPVWVIAFAAGVYYAALGEFFLAEMWLAWVTVLMMVMSFTKRSWFRSERNEISIGTATSSDPTGLTLGNSASDGTQDPAGLRRDV